MTGHRIFFVIAAFVGFPPVYAEPGDLKHPDWHPQGQTLIAEGSCAGGIDLYLIDLASGNVRMLWDGGATEAYPRWFNDGKRIAFHRIAENRSARIFTASVSAAGELFDLNTVADGPFDIEPAPSPNGELLLFTRPGDRSLDIVLFDLRTATIKQQWKTAPNENLASWQADGRHFLFHAKTDIGTQIGRRNTQTGELTVLTSGEGPNLLGNPSPDGSYLVFSSERDGDREIYLLNLQTQVEKRLTNRKGRDGYPRFSPDGKRIAYHSVTDGGFEIVRVMNLATFEVSDFACGIGAANDVSRLSREQ